MRLPRVSLTTSLLIAVAGVAAVPIALDIFIFWDAPLDFRLRATQVTAVPLALMAETAAALVWAARGFKRGTGLRFTVRGMMVAVLLLGVGLGTARWWVRYNFATVYAPSYREDRFAQVRVGMTRREVELLLGRPLRKAPLPGESWEPDDIWVYSEPPAPGCLGDNYWRRWVVFDRGEDGRVVAIVDDYYWD
jgi:SmpA / OmlA family